MRRAWLAAALAVASVGSARADWTVKRDPFDATVVARYKAILARDPYDAGALAALKNLYGRYRTVAQFEKELADDWAGRVVRARMHPDAAHWKAVIEKREDARALFELGLYERAIAATTDVDVQRRSLERAFGPGQLRLRPLRIVWPSPRTTSFRKNRARASCLSSSGSW